METVEKDVAIRPAAWSAQAENLLRDAVVLIAAVRNQVETGAAQLFEIWRCGQLIGVFVLRIDADAISKEGVIVAAAGGDGELAMTATFLPVMEKMFQGCDNVRIHTARPGLAKLLAAQFGYTLQELVLTKDIRR